MNQVCFRSIENGKKTTNRWDYRDQKKGNDKQTTAKKMTETQKGQGKLEIVDTNGATAQTTDFYCVF